MLHSIVLAGLLTGTATSKGLKYTVPTHINVGSDCVMPGEYTIADFTTFTSPADSSQNKTSFHFTDSDTGIDTQCERNSTSISVSNGATPRWPCENSNVEFIYQTSGLTVIEAACPGSSSTGFEASGLTPFNLTCTTAYGGSLCSLPQTPISENFTSLEPRPTE